MKKLFFLLTAITLLNSCDKDGQLFAGKDQLPPETQTGANTVGCLVNGKVYLPSQRGLNSGVTCFYQWVKGGYYFTMAFADEKNYGPDVNIFTAKIELKAGQTYSLDQGYGPNIGVDIPEQTVHPIPV